MCVAPPFATQIHTTTLPTSPAIFQYKSKSAAFLRRLRSIAFCSSLRDIYNNIFYVLKSAFFVITIDYITIRVLHLDPKLFFFPSNRACICLKNHKTVCYGSDR